MSRLFQSYIQSNFGGEHKDFEAVVLEGSDLWHWWRDNSADGHPWRRGQKIVAGRAAFAASIIQSNFGSKGHGNFEVVAALTNSGGQVELWHLWHDNSNVNNLWSFGQRITEPGRVVAGPASIIQSDFGAGSGHGNFEVVVPVVNDNGEVELRHYWHDNSDVNKPWSIGQRVNDPAHEILGGGCVLQSNFGGGHGNFEVAAWVRLPDHRSVLQHYWHDNSNVNLPWQNGQVIVSGVKGNGGMIQSSFSAGTHGNFEVVVPVAGPEGRTYVQHVWHDNSDPNLPWTFGQRVSEIGATSASACLFESDYRNANGHGNFEVLFDECHDALVDIWHPNQEVTLPWIRHAALIPPQFAPILVQNTKRICQLTGEYDRTGWNGVGTPPFAFNRTESKFNIRGTDLGVSFEHRGHLFFMFGDTARDPDGNADWDSIAVCTDTAVGKGLTLCFYPQPPLVPQIDQGAFNVPLDGFSHDGRMFAFFSTDHYKVGDAEVMGRSVLAASDDDGQTFTALLGFSRHKFINVSVELAPLSPMQAANLGWAAGTRVLWIWGSGTYRASPVYLAVVDIDRLLASIASGAAGLSGLRDGDPAVRYLSANADAPHWSPVEQDAVPLFCAGDVGELSCRYNTIFGRYFLTYNSGSPRGIVLRHAAQPWGPWSEPIVIFDPTWSIGPNRQLGYGEFMHVPWNVAQIDHVQDDMGHGRRDNEWGGEYGPYQIPRFSTGTPGQVCDLYYTMSTWNPYQVVLMCTRIVAADLFG